MNPIVVEHIFVTGLPNAQALQLLGQLLKTRGFEQQAAQELDPARPDWTIVRCRRGIADGARIQSLAHFPQNFQIEWDRGRFSLALSLDPLGAPLPVRQQCESLLLWIAGLLESALVGTRSGDEVLAQWSGHENLLVLPHGSIAGRQPIFAAIPIDAWIWVCLVLCGLMSLSALIVPMASWGKLILLLVGGGAAWQLWRLKNGRPPIPNDRARLVTAGLAGGSWSLLLAAIYLVPLVTAGAHRATVGLNVASRGHPGATGPRSTMKVVDMEGVRAALQSDDPANQQAAAQWLSSSATIPPDVHELLRGLLAVDNPDHRKTFVSLFCKSLQHDDVGTIEGICRDTDEHFSSSWQPAFAALLLADPARARKVFEDRSAEHRFVGRASQALTSVTSSHEEIAAALLDSDNKIVVERAMQSLGRSGTPRSISAIETAMSRPIFNGTLDAQANSAINAINRSHGGS